MMDRISHLLRTRPHTITTEPGSFVDYVRVIGPARNTLSQLWRAAQRSTLGEWRRPGTASIGVGMASEKGSRPRNEDSAIVVLGRCGTRQGVVPIVLAAVADGMGGHVLGDRASAIAIEELVEYLVDYLLPAGLTSPQMFRPGNMRAVLARAVRQAHSAVQRGAPDGGSTLTCLLAIENVLHIAHVGDSRAYLIRGGSIDVLTRDHLVVRLLQEQGKLTQKGADTHLQRHVLYRSLGMDEMFEVDVASRMLNLPSRLVLCTDGVWGVLSANDIYARVIAGNEPQDVCEWLVSDAIHHQSNDNATAVLLDLPVSTV